MKEGATERGRREREERGRKGDKEGVNFKGGTRRRTLASIHYTAVSAQTTHNAALAIATLVLRVL